MSVLFTENIAEQELHQLEEEEDILSQFNVDVSVSSKREAPSHTTKTHPTACGLKFRKKHAVQKGPSEPDSRAPYGVPIYDLLTEVGKRKPEGTLSSSDMLPQRKKARVQSSTLLSEKYRPTEFFDLVGNDDANRHAMRWLSRWRSIVYGVEPEVSDYTDVLGRPLKKVLLLNGPPGSGKTSAAHAIAKQAGYDVLEINASDERNAAVVTNRISSAVQSHQAYSKRPICIVADEVEGASEHGFVRALVNILKEDQKAVSLLGQRQQGRGKKRSSQLRRPIIAVCNDVWAPNLHALRQHAEIVHFQRHSPGRLLKRLETICNDEGYNLSARTLSRVADSCDYDMRACLNAIQFGAQYCFDQSRENFELTDWSALAKMQFQASKPASFQQLESCTDLDKLVASCFTAYPTTTYIDDMMRKPAALGEFLDLADHRNTTDEIKAIVAHSFGHMFRSPRLSASKQKTALLGGRAFAKPPSIFESVKNTKSLLGQVLSQSGPSVRKGTSHITALTEVLPYAVKFACPGISLLNSGNSRHIDLAASLRDVGLGLKAEKQENGTLVYRLEPPIESAVIFDEATRNLVSTWKLMPRSQLYNGFSELLRNEMALSVPESTAHPITKLPSSEVATVTAPAPMARKYGFFGKEAPVSATQVANAADQKARKVWVQFSEGFSNAVRKPISWNELFSF